MDHVRVGGDLFGAIAERDDPSKLGLGPETKAVITGASSGIGKAITIAIAATGAAVCLVGRNAERLEAVAGSVRTITSSVLVCETDLTSDSAVEGLACRLKQEFGALDILVHCAGVFMTGKIEATPVEKLDALYRANLRLPFVLTQALLPLLKGRQGQIVFINSSRGLAATATTGPFAATQHALKGLADSLRQEVNADGIRVLSVYPGRTATPRMKALYDFEGRMYQPELLLQGDDIAQVVMTSLQMPRTAEITNIQIRPLTKSY
jgi:NADP-dependent 3-hydroxy acid dehydrogenase YdfG